jgi:hypothetical protein
LSSTGYTEKRVFFQQSTIDLIDQETTNNVRKLSVIRNLNDFIFQIWPKLNYDAHKDYSQKKEMQAKLKWKLKQIKQRNLILEEGKKKLNKSGKIKLTD